MNCFKMKRNYLNKVKVKLFVYIPSEITKKIVSFYCQSKYFLETN